jgi:hypothetical protein
MKKSLLPLLYWINAGRLQQHQAAKPSQDSALSVWYHAADGGTGRQPGEHRQHGD